jgi:hypothetical protein
VPSGAYDAIPSKWYINRSLKPITDNRKLAVSNIISFNEKRIGKKEKTCREKKELKILAIQKIFQCIRCSFKCEKCGVNIQLDPDPEASKSTGFHIPYNFCEGCREEYIAYVLYQKGKTDPKNYWRNKQWAVLWKKWIDYRSAMDSYLQSKEFKKLIEEVREIDPDNKMP